MTNYQRNIFLLYFYEFFSSLHFFAPIIVVYFSDIAHLSFTQIMILQSWYLFCIFLFEIPTGALADSWGRKASLGLACMMTLLGLLLYLVKPTFAILFIAELFWGMATAFFSGADQALLYDSLKKLKKTSLTKSISARLHSLHLLALTTASLLGSWLANSFGLFFPFFLTLFPLIIAFFLAFFFHEPQISQRQRSRPYFSIISQGIRYFSRHSVLKILAFDLISIGTLAYLLHWLSQILFKTRGVPLSLFGLIYAGFIIIQILVMNLFPFFQRLLGSQRRVLLLTSFLLGVFYILAGLTAAIPILIGAVLLAGGFGLGRRVLFTAYINHFIPSSQRATILSTISMLENLGAALLSPLIGYLADFSLSLTFIGIGVAVLIITFFSRIEEKHLRH